MRNLPVEQLHKLFMAVDWSKGSEAPKSYNIPFINSTLVISAWDSFRLTLIGRSKADFAPADLLSASSSKSQIYLFIVLRHVASVLILQRLLHAGPSLLACKHAYNALGLLTTFSGCHGFKKVDCLKIVDFSISNTPQSVHALRHFLWAMKQQQRVACFYAITMA